MLSGYIQWENPDWIGDRDTKADRDVDIEWKQGNARHTTGIRIFEEKFEVPIGGEKTVSYANVNETSPISISPI